MPWICSYCGAKNSDETTTCVNCEMPLSPKSETAKSEVEDKQPHSKQTEVTWIICCPCCGKEYVVPDENGHIQECSYCKDEYDRLEIAKIKPVRRVPRAEEDDPSAHTHPKEDVPRKMERSVLELFEIKRSHKIRIFDDGIIGRDGNGTIDADFFDQDEHISRQHCRVFFEDGAWKVIEDEESLNGTVVDDTRIEPKIAVPLREGGILQLADLCFTVRFCGNEEGAPQNAEHGEQQDKDVPTYKWTVICPICGHIYYVEDEHARVNECAFCSDEIDRKEIALCHAKRVKVKQIQL